MEQSEKQQKAINLGKRLVAELNRGDSPDTISQWMAHYIAGLITQAENAPDTLKEGALQKCFDNILLLWKHRAFIPSGKRPFENFEPILDALDRLSPENERPFYHRLVGPSKKLKEGESDPVKEFIELIFALDSATRILITELLNLTAQEATNQSTKLLLKDAEAFSPSVDIEALNLLFKEGENTQSDSTSDAARKKVIQDRIAKLASFCELAQKVSKQLAKRINGDKSQGN
jgi:hypothetical protein